ncbi:MAG: peptide ABC transporter substrate-binding protein, partial [Fusobacteriaceae bacterium]
MKLNKNLLGIIAISLILGACGTKKEATETVETSTIQKLSYNLGSDPKTIDPQLTTAIDGSIVSSNIFEGLYAEGDGGALSPAVAESVTISDDGTKYIFTLRKEAKWSDGKPVIAHDFVYSWKRAINPDTAAEYAYQLYYLKNAEKYYNGEVGAEEIGVKALDDNTLEVILENATPYFLSLTAFPTYFPLREDIIANNPHWAHSPETYLGNGPFKLSAWNPKENLTLVPNENYWDRDKVKLDELRLDM